MDRWHGEFQKLEFIVWLVCIWIYYVLNEAFQTIVEKDLSAKKWLWDNWIFQRKTLDSQFIPWTKIYSR